MKKYLSIFLLILLTSCGTDSKQEEGVITVNNSNLVKEIIETRENYNDSTLFEESNTWGGFWEPFSQEWAR